ncbi:MULTISPECIES: bifunctional helix-turn-helix transcriptional regulator/GNAT family N-acetyltransferase [unclassified Tenacibaculum]|uniref:bifunctional helix-turn-helix transcriptional regulator/GNAT family N-acetyltransferase n=1 Tax=unclassified Tenacibaculum TaxID=2635139 RepID=UPI001F15C43D|nr:MULTISPECIES: bifunctional helix-turn-helix transcriptional regulator/GNAT family N-acetyltransferase [unclassified Tenacibaculum]MCF2875785.1 GNAT family N-acetyltransferase [Tenacibaculum sp. Cn5-1]MCF2935861.1 GNAT family N-acetyltransferase [Tenacibaculum sp. Cn5-34]MCG7512421.1 GNAT family N-acetyltransferase [Tenacibaculum sp. Cn5-46]
MFYNRVGKIALGSRMRMLSESITEDAKSLYQLYGTELKPKWFPVFYILSKKQEESITTIAEEIGHSHPSVSKIVSEMRKEGIVVEQKDKKDKRRNLISLTNKGLDISDKIENQYKDVDKAIELALSQTQHNIWKAMEEFEYLLKQKSLYKRVVDEKKKRESKNVKIVSYEKKYQSAFKHLNEEWINTYFKIEEADRKALDNPKEYIIDKGGHILVALYNDEPIGVCALLKNDTIQSDFELAKMAVSPKSQGLGIGYKIASTLIEKAKLDGAKEIYLESNTILEPAIKLYEKLGFEKVSGYATPYERCNIQMILKL